MYEYIILPLFGYAAWQDARTRLVSAWIWIPVAGIGLYRIYQFPINGLISMTVTGLVVGLIYYVKSFGLADVKAMVALSMFYPVSPEVQYAPAFDIFSMTVLFNASVIGFAFMLLFAAKNVLSGDRAVKSLYSRQLVPTDDTHGWIRTDGGKVNLMDLDDLPDEPVWVEPGMPYVAFIFVGLIIGLVAGDLLTAFYTYI